MPWWVGKAGKISKPPVIEGPGHLGDWLSNDFEKYGVVGKGCIPLMQTQTSVPVTNVRYKCQISLCSTWARLQPFWCVCSWLTHLTSGLRGGFLNIGAGRTLPSNDQAGPKASAMSFAFQAVRSVPLWIFYISQIKKDVYCLIYTWLFSL